MKDEQFSIPSSSHEQNEVLSAQQKPDVFFAPTTVIGWRSRVLCSFAPEERVLHFVDIRGRHFRIKKASEVEAHICELLRETMTIADLLAHGQQRYVDLTEKTVYRLLHLLMEQALIETKNISPPSIITAEEVERYDRQLRFFGLFAHNAQDRFHMQKNLSQATVTILGLGGVGNWVARHLTAMGIGRLILVDYDIVEHSNLNRQALYTPTDLGKQKVEVAARTLKAFNPHVKVQAISLKITSPEDIEQVIKEASIAVLTADKPMIMIRRWMTIACARQQLPYVQGSLDAYLLQIGPFYHVPHTGCYACRETNAQFTGGQNYTARIENYLLSPRDKPPLLGPLCGFVGSAVALEATRYLSKYQAPSTFGCSYVIDARTWTTRVEQVPRNKDCLICGSSSAQDREGIL